MSLGRSLATIGGWTMLSRLAGLARETLVASYLGAGAVSDALVVACRFPNMFRALFAEGAFNAAFVPLFAGKLEAEGMTAARRFAEQAYTVLGCLLLAMVIAMELAMPWAIYALAPGFDRVPGKMALATSLSRIAFPYLLFISLVSLQSGVLNALGRFAAAAGTPILLSLVSMALLVLLAPFTPTLGHAAAWGVFASGVAQFLWLLFAMRRAGMTLRLVPPVLTPEVRQLLRNVVPGAVGAGVYQFNLYINTVIASHVGNGAVSFLYYADRINQVPLGVIGIAIGTALLPALSRSLRAGHLAAAGEQQNRAVELGLLLALPAAFALAVIARPIVTVLYQHGSFTGQEGDNVSAALVAFSFGLPALVIIKALTASFFARQDTRTPVKAALASMAVNIALNLLLMTPLRHVGMALSTTIAAWVNMLFLAWRLHRLGHFILDRRLAERAPRILAACVGMALLLAGLRSLTEGWWPPAALALLVSAGLGAYGGFCLLTRAMRLSDVRAMLRRKAD